MTHLLKQLGLKHVALISIGVFALFLSACAPQLTSPKEAEVLSSDSLVGTWDVALYFSPDSPPSATVMEVTAALEDGTLEGSFYQSPFELGRYVIKDDQLIISVVTSDGSGRYQTSGRLSASGLFIGQTHSIGREFLMPWTAERQSAQPQTE